MFRYVSPIGLILWATTSTAAIQNSDFWFHDDGDTIFIDGHRGAPLHIDYIGPPLKKPLAVSVTPNNPKLKIAAPICTFTQKNHDCRLTVQLKNQSEKVYDINHFTVTEVGVSQGVLNAQAASETSTVGFGVGVQGKDMPKPINAYWHPSTYAGGLTTKVIVTNSTSRISSYQGKIPILHQGPPGCATDGIDFGPRVAKPLCALVVNSHSSSATGYIVNRISTTSKFDIPPHGSCYLDYDIIPEQMKPTGDNSVPYEVAAIKGPDAYISDITNPESPLYNGFNNTSKNYITSCSAKGVSDCTSNKWGSWTVGLANLGAKDMAGGVRAGQIEVLRDNSWNNGAFIYWETGWNNENLAILMIQGSTDGSENWDVKAATPSILEIKSAPPCSNYFKGDPSVTYKVLADVYGPGSVTMSGGEQCVIVKVPKSEFTRCTGSGYWGEWYEITAVPEAGKTFKGWNSKGLCDDAKTTCRIPLSSHVTLQPYFW